MSGRERGWTIAGLVVAVVLLVGSVTWAVGAGLGSPGTPRWHDHHGRPDRGASAQQDLPGTVAESGSPGEASEGAAGAGEGIEPGGTGWVTLDLEPGRYELVCNLPGHYAAGMYALLVVT